MNITAIAMFAVFVGLTMFITWRATTTLSSFRDKFYTGVGITFCQNGLAMAAVTCRRPPSWG